MKGPLEKTILALYVLTLTVSLVSTLEYGIGFFATLILGISGIKFLLVAFQFMEMKKAHPFWKWVIGIYLVGFVGIVSLILH